MESTKEKIPFQEEKCARCNTEFKRTLGFFNLDKRKCFVCKKYVCYGCSAKEERYDVNTNKKGYPCLDCYKNTKREEALSFIPSGNNLMAMAQIPVQLQEVSNKLEELGNIIEQQTVETRDFTRIFFNENIHLVREEMNVKINEIKIVAEEQIDRTQEVLKRTAREILDENWEIIKKDIYKIIGIAYIGIFFLSGIITVEIFLITKIFNHFFG